MQFATIIKNNLGENRKLVWLKGREIDANGTLVLIDTCLPMQLTVPEQRSMMGELHGGAITIVYATDTEVVKLADIESKLKSLEAIKATIAEPVEKVPVKAEELIQPVFADTTKTTKVTKALGTVEMDKEDKSATLGDTLTSEGSLEDFQPSRVAFTEHDAESVNALPLVEQAFTEPKVTQSNPGKVTEQLFESDTAPSVQQPKRTRTRKDA